MSFFSDFRNKMVNRASKRRFSTVHTPQSLLERSSEVFPAMIPWVERDISKESCNLGQWRLMESPLMFLARRRCILDPAGRPFQLGLVYNCGDVEPIPGMSGYDPIYIAHPCHALEPVKDPSLFPLPNQIAPASEQERIGRFEQADLIPITGSCYLNTKMKAVKNRIDNERLKFFLYEQLGEKFESKTQVGIFKDGRNYGPFNDPFWIMRDGPNWRYSLATALYLHGRSDRSRKAGLELFDMMNQSLRGGGEIRAESIRGWDARTLLTEKWSDDEYFLDKVMIHSSFANVFFMALLKYARRRGVVSTSLFGWVKALDRPLWYALSQTGRSVCCAEAAGAWSHYWCEESLGRTIGEPCLDLAVEGFENEMRAEGWLPKEN